MAKKAEKPLSKTDILNALAESTEMSRKEVGGVIDALEALIAANISRGPGVFNLPGLLKIYVHERPATKERMGRNPATGEGKTVKISCCIKYNVSTHPSRETTVNPTL